MEKIAEFTFIWARDFLSHAGNKQLRPINGRLRDNPGDLVSMKMCRWLKDTARSTKGFAHFVHLIECKLCFQRPPHFGFHTCHRKCPDFNNGRIVLT